MSFWNAAAFFGAQLGVIAVFVAVLLVAERRRARAELRWLERTRADWRLRAEQDDERSRQAVARAFEGGRSR